MKKKVLVVDDNIDIVEPISLLLKMQGYVVDATTKGEQIYKKVEESKPDVILLDILMSGSDGRTICKTLKNNNATKYIPIILMSAHPGVGKDIKDCHADGFIAKPFETKDLLQVVKKNIK